MAPDDTSHDSAVIDDDLVEALGFEPLPAESTEDAGTDKAESDTPAEAVEGDDVSVGKGADVSVEEDREDADVATVTGSVPADLAADASGISGFGFVPVEDGLVEGRVVEGDAVETGTDDRDPDLVVDESNDASADVSTENTAPMSDDERIDNEIIDGPEGAVDTLTERSELGPEHDGGSADDIEILADGSVDEVIDLSAAPTSSLSAFGAVSTAGPSEVDESDADELKAGAVSGDASADDEIVGEPVSGDEGASTVGPLAVGALTITDSPGVVDDDRSTGGAGGLDDGIVALEPEPRVAEVEPVAVSAATQGATVLGGGLDRFRRRPRLRARKSRRVVRHIDPWSVLTFSVLFHLCFFAAMLLASVLVWNAAVAAGTIENIENFVRELGDYETFEINSDEVFRSAVIIAGMLTLASSIMVVLLTVVFNLISDLIGGIRVTVIEEEKVRVVDHPVATNDGASGSVSTGSRSSVSMASGEADVG